jgi:Sec-independent protein translocase protein TatA
MFGLSFIEIAFIMVTAFMIFGPEQFPTMVKKAFMLIKEVKNYISEAQNSLHTIASDLEKDINPLNWEGGNDFKKIKNELESLPEEISENIDLIESGEYKNIEAIQPANKNKGKYKGIEINYDKNSIELDVNKEAYSAVAIDLIQLENNTDDKSDYSLKTIDKSEL